MEASPTTDQIRTILRSQTFANKRQLRKLLEILSEHVACQHLLTTELIIRELWPDEVRTKRSADVATEMNRLRHALKDYYESEGASDGILVTLPNRALASVNGTLERLWITVGARGVEDTSAGVPLGEFTPNRSQDAQRSGFPDRRISRNNWQHLPAKRTVAAASALFVAVLIALYVSLRAIELPDQPKFARLDGSVLRVMDSEGKELWSKGFPDGVGPDYYYNEKLSWVGGTHVWFADLEGKGHTSVLFSYSPATPGIEAHSSTLICYSDRGKEKWRWSPGRYLPELNGSPATYFIHSLGILRPTKERPLRIVVASQQIPWWPSQIALLDTNGKTVSEYWHSGGVVSMVVADLYGDGREEIVTAGIANGYDHQATLVVLDADRVFGASKEVRPEFQIHGMGNAQERLRLLFPRSDLNRALYQYNHAFGPTVEHGILRLTVAECISTITVVCPVWYEFDKNSNLIAAYAGGDGFRSEHNKFFQTGKNAHTLSAEEQAQFRKVRCLVGCTSDYVPVGKLIP